VRKIAATVAVVAGIGLIALPFALSLFDRAPAGERVIDRFRPTMSTKGLGELKDNFATMGALLDEFVHRTSPELARELHMSGPAFDAFVAASFPGVAAGVERLPPLVAFVTPVAARLETLHPQFEGIDSLPFLGLSLSTVPWILLLLGVALTGLGLIVLRTRTRSWLVVLAVVGGAMIIAPLALSYPRKVTDAQEIVAVGRAALSQEAAAGAQEANELIDGLVTEVQGRTLPALAARLHVAPVALTATLARRYPAVTSGLEAWPSIKPGAVELVRRQVASVPDGNKMNGLDFAPLPWYIIGPGIALLLAGGLALVPRR